MVFCHRISAKAKGSQRHSQFDPKGLERDSYHSSSEPTEVCRAGVLIKSSSVTFYKNSLIRRELLCLNQRSSTMKPYPVANIFYLPLQYAVSLVNQGVPQSDAAKQAIDRFAYYGKHQNKRLKAFDINQFNKHFNRFLNTPNATLVRKSSKR